MPGGEVRTVWRVPWEGQWRDARGVARPLGRDTSFVGIAVRLWGVAHRVVSRSLPATGFAMLAAMC